METPPTIPRHEAPRLNNPPPAVAHRSGFVQYATLACAVISVVLLLTMLTIVVKRDGSRERSPGISVQRLTAQEQTQMRQAIETVLQKDRELSRNLGARISAGTNAAQAIMGTASRMKTLDISGCPSEFREAYVRHANAWRALGAQVARDPQTISGGVLLGMLKMVAGEKDAGAVHAMRVYTARDEAISTSWDEVEAIAARYGARLQP